MGGGDFFLYCPQTDLFTAITAIATNGLWLQNVNLETGFESLFYLTPVCGWCVAKGAALFPSAANE